MANRDRPSNNRYPVQLQDIEARNHPLGRCSNVEPLGDLKITYISLQLATSTHPKVYDPPLREVRTSKERHNDILIKADKESQTILRREGGRCTLCILL